MFVSQEKQIEKRKKFCPSCGTEMEPGTVFCGKCGYKIVEESDKNNKKFFRYVSVFVVAVVIGGIMKFGILGVMNLPGGNKEIPNLYYVKDNTAYGRWLENLEREPLEFGTDENMGELFRSTGRLFAERPTYNVFYFQPDLMSPDGEYQLTIGDVQTHDGEITYSLFYRKNEQTRLDTGIEVHEIAGNGSVIYKKGGNLYISNLKSITKIASNVGEFYLDHKKEKVLWTEEREDEDTGIRLVDCYTQEIKNGEKKQIASQAHLTGFTENFSKITGWDKDGSFIIRDQEEREEIGATRGDLETEIFIGMGDYNEKTGKRKVLVYKDGVEFPLWVSAGENERILNLQYSQVAKRFYVSFADHSNRVRLISFDCDAASLLQESRRVISSDDYDAASLLQEEGTIKEILSNISQFQLVIDKKTGWDSIYYVEDKEDEEEQQLFCDQTQILSGQYLSLYKPRDGYIWVLDNHDLYRIEGKEEKLISNSALWLQTLDNGEALIFENYDPNNQSGDLVYYDGKTNWLIEPDVKAFVYLDE